MKNNWVSKGALEGEVYIEMNVGKILIFAEEFDNSLYEENICGFIANNKH